MEPTTPTPFPVYAFVNQKGGCGKTTTAVNLAGALAARGERVLLVDLDPQAHATLGLGCSPERPTVADVLLGEAPLVEAVVPAPGRITLLPSEPRLAEFEEVSGRMIHPEQRLQRALVEAHAAGVRFDHVVVDCSPRADGVLCANALFASRFAFLIVETGAFALQGAVRALEVLDEVADNQGRAFDVRVVGTMFDRRTKFARELLVALHGRFAGAMFDTVIRTSVRLREAPALGVPVQVLDPTSRAAEDFAALADEVVALVPAPDGAAQNLSAPSDSAPGPTDSDPGLLRPAPRGGLVGGPAPTHRPDLDLPPVPEERTGAAPHPRP
ncbi:MAG: ParA family protein [Planctomycetota bacterium]